MNAPIFVTCESSARQSTAKNVITHTTGDEINPESRLVNLQTLITIEQVQHFFQYFMLITVVYGLDDNLYVHKKIKSIISSKVVK